MNPRDFLRDALKPQISTALIPSIFAEVDFCGKTGQYLRATCPLCRGDNKTIFSVHEDLGSWQCWKCGEGRSSDALNWIQAITGLEFKEAVIELAARMGIDYSSMGSSRSSFKRRAPVKPKPKPKKKLRDLTPVLGDALLGTTKEAREYLYERLPGMKEHIDAMIEDGVFIAPPIARDQDNPAGVYNRARVQGYHLAVPMWDVEESDIITSAAMRNVIPELKPEDMKKAILYNGPKGGEYGGTMGQLHKALEHAEFHGCLILGEGITDFVTLEAIGLKNKLADSGNNIIRVLEYLLKTGWKGRIVSVIDNDTGSDQSHYNCGKLCEGTSIEYCDGRPPRDVDITDYFVQNGGGGDGSRAVMSLIENATLYLPNEEHNRSGQAKAERAKLKQAEIMADYKECWGPRRKYIQQVVEEDQRKKLEHEKREAARQARLDLKAPAKALFELWKTSERGAYVVGQVVRLLLTHASDLSAGAVEKLLKLSQIPDFEAVFEKAKGNPIENTGRESITRLIIKNSKGQKAHAVFAALAHALGAPTVQYLHCMGFNFSPHRDDRAFMEFVATVKNPVHAKKIRSNQNCSCYHRDHNLKSTGELVRTVFNLCGSQICTFCWGHYLAQQDSWTRKSKGWKGRFTVGFVKSETNTPEAVTQVWEESMPLLRDIPLRAVMRPACPDLGLSAGVLFIARETEESITAFNSFMDDVRSAPGEAALSEFTTSLAIVPLLFQSQVIRHEEELGYFHWLNRCQLARRRGRVNFEWRSIRNWKEFKKSLDGVSIDERPQEITHFHTDSGIPIYQHGSEEVPPQHWEIMKKAGECLELQEWQDNHLLERLPSTIGRLLLDRRQMLRERYMIGASKQ